LWYPTADLTPGTRTVVKLDYVARNFSTPRWFSRFFQSISWFHPMESMPLRHVGADGTHHVEFESPRVLPIRKLEPLFMEIVSDSHEESPSEKHSNTEPPTQHIALQGSLAHAYIAGNRPMGVDLYYRLAPAPFGFIASAFVACFLIAIFATVLFKFRDNIDRHELGPTVALLTLVPALIGYLITRAASTPLVRGYLFGVQVLVVVAAILPLVMASALVINGENLDARTQDWRWCLIALWFIVAVVLVGFVRALVARQHSSE
jgi:hypothetical protein